MKHFTIEQLCFSQAAKDNNLDNSPNIQQQGHLNELINYLLDPLMEAWTIECQVKGYGSPVIKINSGFRTPEVNKLVKGSATSAHLLGYAADIVPANNKMLEFKKFVERFLTTRNFDQCIWEHPVNGIPKWIHLGYKNERGVQRKLVFTLP